MNISYYCQHVLGIGHFHRSMEICKALAEKHSVTIIVGGPPVEVTSPHISVLQLPGLQMDETFKNMIPCQAGLQLEQVKTARKEKLFRHFKEYKPDIFLTELYPFGRKAFRFELEPILSAIRAKTLPHCLCYCSVRDILVEKTSGKEKFERRVIKSLNESFSGVLVHADPTVVTLETTFDLINKIQIPLHYTGFVAKKPQSGSGADIRSDLALPADSKLIVASIGGGSVGIELLQAVTQAFTHLPASNVHLQLFCGPYCDQQHYKSLQRKARKNISVDRFTAHFPAWLEAADLSVSMAGYNTCMNLIRSGVPSLVFPFRQNREQLLRAEKLGKRAPLTILKKESLRPAILADLMVSHLQKTRIQTDILLNGAEETARQIEVWHRTHNSHD